MLILQRKLGEAIKIGDNITVRITDISSDRVKIAIEAPKDISIFREELVKAVETNIASSNIDIDLIQNMINKNTKN